MYTVPKLEDYSPETLDRAYSDVERAFDEELRAINRDGEVKPFLNRWFAGSGILAAVNDWLRQAPKEQKKAVGERLKNLQTFLDKYREAHRRSAQGKVTLSDLRALQTQVTSEAEAFESQRRVERDATVAIESIVDITLPGTRRPLGAEHPVIRTMNEIVGVFKAMGYSTEEGPEIETDYYNFEALNFPPNHPARDMQDTLFVARQDGKQQRDRLMLRTHTSPVQIRSMMKRPPPLRVVCPGKVHRRDTADATHSPVFHQVEGLTVDTNITFSDLKGTLDHAMKALFGSNVRTRFQPSFFPFTEPSAEVAISCIFCGGKGCRVCKQSGWVELLGCGMVHPNVFENVRQYGYDPAKISGFAFGMGADRIAAFRWGIDDIQLFFEGDVRFLEQFG